MVSKEDVKKIAKLARITLSEEEVEEYAREMERVLEFFNILSDVPPADDTVIFPVPAYTRKDVPKKCKEKIIETDEDGYVRSWPL